MKMESYTLYFPTNVFKISFQDSELMLANFMSVLDKTLMFCGHAVIQAPHRLQKSKLVTALPSTMLTALHGQTS